MPKFLRAHPTIGVLCGQPVYSARLSQYLGLVCRGISAAAQQKECNVLFACGIDSPGAGYNMRSAWPVAGPENDFVPVGPWNTDALIVIQPVSVPGLDYLQTLSDSGFPVIFIGPRSRGRAVTGDNRQGIHAALNHLAEHGHRQIAFIAGSANDQGDSGERLEAYYSGLRQLNFPINPALVAYGEHNWFGGQRAMRELSERGQSFSAILASNDESARGALDWLRKTGRRVPDELALIGFDDQTEARGTYPTLTSIHNPMFEMGQQGLALALWAASGEAPPECLVRIPTRLVLRQSCGCAPWPHTETTFDPPSETLQAVVANETRYIEPERVGILCAELLEAWNASTADANPQPFQGVLRSILAEVEAANDDAHAWQAALSYLAQPPLTHEQNEWIHTARTSISESIRRQHNHYILMQWVDDDVARMTAQLLAAKDQAQVIRILDDELPLAPTLPAVSIQRAHIALLEPEDGSPTAISRILSGQNQPEIQFHTNDFPPASLGYSEPFSLALLPLAFKDAETLPGYVIMEMANLSPYAAFIVQHLTVALNSVRLNHDATEGRRLAENANQIKSRFLSMVSHELRTPLSVIVGLSEMALRSALSNGPALPEVYREDLERIYASARHLSGLIGDVLDLASSEAGQLKFNPDLLDFQEVLKPALTVAEHLTRSKGLEWRLALPQEPLPIRGDATRLRQVTLNLLNNAVKFTAQGFVALTVSIEAHTLKVSVSDSGVGIPLGEQTEIFNEFRQSERTAARGYGGVGLGLAICKRIVEMHGGSIGVSSSGEEDSGSTFFFELPLLTEQPEILSAPAQSASVMVLHETEDPNNALVVEYLENEGYTVQECSLAGNPQWLNQVAAALPDTLVLNMQPHSAQTWEIFRRIKDQSITHDLPILLYTLTQEQNRGDLLKLDYLSKPISSEALWQTLQRQGVFGKNRQDAHTILVVDDEMLIRELHCRMIQEYAPDYRVLAAADGRSALEILKETPVDLVLLDLMMPQMDGFTLLKLLRDNNGLNHDVPVIVLTAQILNESEMSRLNDGVAKVLGKGMFTIHETLTHVGAALARNQKTGGEAQRLVRKAMAYIHTHYMDTITRKDIARYTNVNEDYLTHCFQQELGLSPVAYITRHRIQQAKQYLTRGGMNITAVAQAVGIVDSDYFSRVFRQETGVSPREFKRQQQDSPTK